MTGGAKTVQPFKSESNIESQGSVSFNRWFILPYVAGAACLLSVAGAIFAVQVEVEGETTYAIQGLLFLGLAAAGYILVQWARRSVLQLHKRAQELFERRQAELREIASRDDLTQLQNRRFFYERLQAELDKAKARKRPLAILMMDVDDLKAINDEFGHQVGDIVLTHFARMLNRQARPLDVTARLGGDEFAIIMPESDRREAEALAQRLWEAMEATPAYQNQNASIYLGVSIGVGGYPWRGDDIEEIIHWADADLYTNKLARKGIGGESLGHNNRLSSAVVEVLSTALEIRDKLTHRHARRVARMAAAVALELGLDEDEVVQIRYAAALHDIGKIGVADYVLCKPDPLTPEEWSEMRRHSELGYEILNGIDFLKEAAQIVYAHHERYDGSGYPRGLAGGEIPLGARVFAVVDAFDAMTSRRPYREATPRERALAEIAGNAGTQFDPQVVAAFLEVLRQGANGANGNAVPGSSIPVGHTAGAHRSG